MKVFANAGFSVMWSAFFNWAVLYYSGDTSYIQVLAREFRMRSTNCWLDQLEQSICDKLVFAGLI